MSTFVSTVAAINENVAKERQNWHAKQTRKEFCGIYNTVIRAQGTLQTQMLHRNNLHHINAAVL